MLQPRAALYCRLSKEDAEKQQESESIQNQKIKVSQDPLILCFWMLQRVL